MSTKQLHELRELIRTKYKLDVVIWALRGVRKPDRSIVEGKMQQADAIMKEITNTVNGWGPDSGWTESEKERAEEIKRRINLTGKRCWMENPP